MKVGDYQMALMISILLLGGAGALFFGSVWIEHSKNREQLKREKELRKNVLSTTTTTTKVKGTD